jgi:hypothetical protein
MTAKTSEMLAAACDELGLFQIAHRARKDEFHDFLSPHDMPEMYLVQLLYETARIQTDPIMQDLITKLRARVINGDFDASPEESDAWAASEEGQAVFRQFFEKKIR